ncbi:MAG TPA: hypothetical protein VEY50_09335 [Lysobacter sp.]|nr:hypothetical protein [Lysobacter sp.]
MTFLVLLIATLLGLCAIGALMLLHRLIAAALRHLLPNCKASPN